MNSNINYKKGLFISLEGIDGAGKSTQLEVICNFLKQNNIEYMLTREPGGTPLGEKIRELLLNDDMSIETEALLMFASRQEHVQKVIQPNLDKGIWVISDRFTDSSYAYQCGGRGLNSEKIFQLKQWTLDRFEPDLTFLFDISPEIAYQRMIGSRQNLDRFEKMNLEFFQNVRNYYLAIAEKNPERVLILDCHQNVETVSQFVIESMQELIN